MCVPILKGQQSEWAILRRHESEDIFGVQVIVTSFATEFLAPFSNSVRNSFLCRKKSWVWLKKMGMSRLLIKLDIKAVRHWNCE